MRARSALCAPIEALAGQDADLDLDHVEPAGVPGTVGDPQPAHNPPQRKLRLSKVLAYTTGQAFELPSEPSGVLVSQSVQGTGCASTSALLGSGENGTGS